MMGEGSCRHNSCQVLYSHLQWKLSSCCSCVVWFMNYEVVMGKIERKEGLGMGNKFFEKTIKLCADSKCSPCTVNVVPVQ